MVTGQPVILRQNFGTNFRKIGRIQLVTDKWLHIFRIALPTAPTHNIRIKAYCPAVTAPEDFPHEHHQRCMKAARQGHPLPHSCQRTTYRRFSDCQARKAYSQVADRIYADFKKEYDHLLHRINVTFTNFGRRPKRAWLDISGIFSKVFGFGRQKDMDSMNQAVQTLEQKFKDSGLAQQKIFDDMHSALDLTRVRMGRLSDKLGWLSNYTQTYIRDMVHRTNDFLQFTSTQFRDFHFLQAELHDISIEIRKLESGLATLMQGHISPELVSFDLAKTVLDEIANHLSQTGAKEIVAITTAQEFYAIEDFYIQRQDNTLYLGIHIPISFSNTHFSLFSIDTFPLPASANSSHITYLQNPQSYLAQSLDRRFYFHPTTQDLLAYCTPTS